MKFVPVKATNVGTTVAERLAEISRFESAGEAYLSIERYKESIDMFVAGDKWDRARAVAREHAPQFEQRVEDEYVASLKKRGKAEELASVDVIAGLDLLASRGQWAKCLQTAENEVRVLIGSSTTKNLESILKSRSGSMSGSGSPGEC